MTWRSDTSTGPPVPETILAKSPSAAHIPVELSADEEPGSAGGPAQLFAGESQPTDGRRLEIHQQRVGLRDQLTETLLSRIGIQIEGDAGLVAVEACEVAGSHPAGDLAPARLDLGDLGAEVGQQHGRVRTGQHGTDLEDPYPRQRSGVGRQGNSAASEAITSRVRRFEATSSSGRLPIDVLKNDRSVSVASAQNHR